MLFDELKVKVHLKKTAIFFPFSFIFNFCIGVKWIAKISLDCLFKPPDVFHCIIWKLLMMNVIKLVVVFLIFAYICVYLVDSKKRKDSTQ